MAREDDAAAEGEGLPLTARSVEMTGGLAEAVEGKGGEEGLAEWAGDAAWEAGSGSSSTLERLPVGGFTPVHGACPACVVQKKTGTPALTHDMCLRVGVPEQNRPSLASTDVQHVRGCMYPGGRAAPTGGVLTLQGHGGADVASHLLADGTLGGLLGFSAHV